MTTGTTDLPAAIRDYIRTSIDPHPDAETVRRLRRSYIEGVERATRVANSHGTNDPWKLANALGVAVERDLWPGIDGPTVFGTYTGGTVTLYTEQIEVRATECGVPAAALECAVLAHELAHHEFDHRPLTRTESRVSWWRRLLPGGQHAHVSKRSAEELACHAFADTLVDLPDGRHPVELTTPDHVSDHTTDRTPNHTTDHTPHLTHR